VPYRSVEISADRKIRRSIPKKLRDPAGSAIRRPCIRNDPNGNGRTPHHKRTARIIDARATLFRRCDSMVLCRCGKTKNPPFCDGSHRNK
jgi:hypothetical protein